MADDDAVQIKLVVVGDGAIGKTCLLIGYEKDEFPTDYIPTVFENVTIDKEMNINGERREISLDLWDTAGQEEFDRLRHLAYRETDIFLLCFSCVEPSSFQNLQTRWLPEVQHHSPDALLVLIGLKCDLRNDEKVINNLKETGKEPVSSEQIEEYRKNCGAAAYVETSALKKINVETAFESAISCFLNPSGGGKKKKESGGGGCCIIV
mmetsp:Transcript_72197/g.64901  ORF Transcript_72197/g.64901 Transcript_72197/m.64901 type:complete len:208 (+) Transcript_72197:44-667(+)